MRSITSLFRRSLNVQETITYLDEIEELAKLPYFLPAAERLNMLSAKASRKILGPGGPLHDRLLRCMQLVMHNSAPGGGMQQQVRITPAWLALPGALMATADFEGKADPYGEHLVMQCHGKDMVIFANANPNVREIDPERQMHLYWEFIDNPRWSAAIFIFSGSMIIRSSVIVQYPDTVASSNFGESISKLCAAAAQMGKVKVFK